MSDAQQGPDWWLASDGKWYPPQSRSLPPPPAPPGLRLPDKSSIGNHLPGWLQGLLWSSAALLSLSGLFVLIAVNAAEKYFYKDMRAIDEWVDAEDTYTTLFGLSVLLGIASFVLLIIWTYRLHKVSSAHIDRRDRKWSSGWSIGGWFVPLANFVIPGMVISESIQVARARQRTGSGTNWRRIPRDSLLIYWWVLYGVGILLNQAIGFANSIEIVTDDDFSTYRISMWVGSVGLFVTAAGVICATLSVGRATKLFRWLESTR